MPDFSEMTGFEWDDANRLKNWERHHVAWWECEEAFFHKPFYVIRDMAHSQKEDRYFALGRTKAGRPLFLAFTLRGSRIRVISARDKSRRERTIYDEKAKKNSTV
ncbi:MAG: BrnT family toxin [Acidobacteriia bacterium]|nr:BrnT family toxin [Terriglobia bacterium]